MSPGRRPRRPPEDRLDGRAGQDRAAVPGQVRARLRPGLVTAGRMDDLDRHRVHRRLRVAAPPPTTRTRGTPSARRRAGIERRTDGRIPDPKMDICWFPPEDAVARHRWSSVRLPRVKGDERPRDRHPARPRTAQARATRWMPRSEPAGRSAEAGHGERPSPRRPVRPRSPAPGRSRAGTASR